MSATNIEQKAIGLVRAVENAGKSVSRVTVDGRKIEIVLGIDDREDQFEGIEMRYGKA